MEYKKGTIVTAHGFVFKDGEKDPKKMRPAMLAITSDSVSGEVYLLALTSKVHRYSINPDQYYDLSQEEWKEAKLEFPSLIKLETIHKMPFVDGVTGGLPPKIYKKVLNKLKKYCEQHYDPVYDQIKDQINEQLK